MSRAFTPYSGAALVAMSSRKGARAGGGNARNWSFRANSQNAGLPDYSCPAFPRHLPFPRAVWLTFPNLSIQDRREVRNCRRRVPPQRTQSTSRSNGNLRLAVVEKIIEYYKANAKPKERMGKMIERLGLAHMEEALASSVLLF